MSRIMKKPLADWWQNTWRLFLVVKFLFIRRCVFFIGFWIIHRETKNGSDTRKLVQLWKENHEKLHEFYTFTKELKEICIKEEQLQKSVFLIIKFCKSILHQWRNSSQVRSKPDNYWAYNGSEVLTQKQANQKFVSYDDWRKLGQTKRMLNYGSCRYQDNKDGLHLKHLIGLSNPGCLSSISNPS